jgi:hypothetical protein
MHLVAFSQHLLSYKIIVDADDDDDDDDDDEFEDDMSIDSDTSAESMDTLEFVAHHTYDYGSYIYNGFEDPEINWDSPPLKIADMSEAQCLADFVSAKITCSCCRIVCGQRCNSTLTATTIISN